MNTFSSLDKQKLLINQDEVKREKLKILFDYYIEKMRISILSLKDSHLYLAESETHDDLVAILESNTNEFKVFLDSVVLFESELLESFKKTLAEQKL
jgi:hypothetical protein